MADNVFHRLLDAGVQFTGLSQAKADALLRKLVSDGEIRRKDAEQALASFVDMSKDAVDKGKDAAEAFVVRVQREVSGQIDRLSARVDDLEQRFEELVGAIVSRTAGAPGPAPAPPAKKAPAKKQAAKKAPAKKAAAKKAPAKKAAAKKAAAKKVPAKQQATGPSGVRRVSTGSR